MNDFKTLIYAVLSSPVSGSFSEKMEIRAVDDYFQFTEFKSGKALHKNIPAQEFTEYLELLLSQYRQAMIYTPEADYHLLMSKKGKTTVLKKPPSRKQEAKGHNRKKNYLFPEGKPIPFLVELGIMRADGSVYPQKRDKFIQVNRFLEIVADTVSALPKEGPIHVVDFGCGKATLTFGLFVYLESLFAGRVHVYGVDQRSDVIEFCKKTASNLHLDRLHFSQGSIESFDHPVSMVVALHACDTATDDALAKAIHAQADVILAVPCCHHELASQIEHDMLAPIFKHGILKERFATLVTDAVRAELLSEWGYQTQVLEFIDLEHTAKNLLIRAIKSGKKTGNSSIFQKALHLNPALARKLKKIQ